MSDDHFLDQCIRENQEISKDQAIPHLLDLKSRLNYISSSYDFYKKNMQDPAFIPKKEFYLRTLLKIANISKTTKAVTKKDNTKKKELFALHHKIEEELLDLSKTISLQSVLSEVIEEISSKKNGSVILLTDMH